jgi:DNA polymerase III subunit alpha, Gram-positive type
MFTVIDIETTGLSRYNHEITEIAAAKVIDGKVIDTFQTLVNPMVRIPAFITKLTGIDNEMVKFAPTVDKVLPAFLNFIGEDVFVAHNATFDFGFLEHNLKQHHEIQLLNRKLCTRKLANRLFTDLPRKRLKDLCELFNIQNSQAHRAMADVDATVRLFLNMLHLMHGHGISDVEEILAFEKRPSSVYHS